jgi:hypothetical protein
VEAIEAGFIWVIIAPRERALLMGVCCVYVFMIYFFILPMYKGTAMIISMTVRP